MCAFYEPRAEKAENAAKAAAEAHTRVVAALAKAERDRASEARQLAIKERKEADEAARLTGSLEDLNQSPQRAPARGGSAAMIGI